MITETNFTELEIGHRIWDVNGIEYRVKEILRPYPTVSLKGHCTAGVTICTKTGDEQNIFWDRGSIHDSIINEDGSPADLFDSNRASCDPFAI